MKAVKYMKIGFCTLSEFISTLSERVENPGKSAMYCRVGNIQIFTQSLHFPFNLNPMHASK